MQSEALKQEEIEALAREMAKGVKTEADLEAVTRTFHPNVEGASEA